jgi:4-hydroxybenzoate polyprenyltransferase
MLFSRLLGSRPGWVWYLCLAATVWLLYTGDHVVDAWRHRKMDLRPLHRYIFRNRRSMLWFMGVVLVVDILLVLNLLNPEMLKISLALGGLVLLFYAMRHVFRRNRLFFIPGEIFVMLLYLAGILLGPYVTRNTEPGPPEVLVGLMVSGVLLMNLGIISLYDVNLDQRLGISSLARVLGPASTRNILFATFGGVLLLQVMQFMVYGQALTTQIGLILLGMALVLLMILLYPSRFRNKEYYRLAADATLYMAFLSLLVPA